MIILCMLEFIYMNSYMNSYDLWIRMIISYMNSYGSWIHIYIYMNSWYQGSRCSPDSLRYADLGPRRALAARAGPCHWQPELVAGPGQAILSSTWRWPWLGPSDSVRQIADPGPQPGLTAASGPRLGSPYRARAAAAAWFVTQSRAPGWVYLYDGSAVIG